MKETKINIGNETIALYESEGKGPAALLIHASCLSAESYFKQLNSTLGETFHLIAMDLPGHGKSLPASDPEYIYSLPGYASIIIDIVNKFEIKIDALVGHSIGGHIIFEAYNDLPDIKGIVIFGTPPLGKPPSMDKAFLPSPSLGMAFKEGLTEEEIKIWALDYLKEGDEIPDYIINNIKKTDPKVRTILGASVGAGKMKNAIEIVENIKCPLLIIHGSLDATINLEYIKNLNIPALWKSEVQVIDGAGHSPQLETPDEFNKILGDFLEDVTG